MKIKVLSVNKDSVRFTIDGIGVEFANALRRIIMAEVPTLAIEEVSFIQNGSALYDEIIAHRLGLIPITTDLSSLDENSRIIFTLDKKGPTIVYSADLKSKDKGVKVVDKNMPIVKLLKGQTLKLEAIARLGRMREHAKWQGGLATYKHHPAIKITKECDGCGVCVKRCPRGILGKKANKIKVVQIEECSLCKTCSEVCEKGAIIVEGIKNKFIFYVESYGAMPAKDLVLNAADILRKKGLELAKAIK